MKMSFCRNVLIMMPLRNTSLLNSRTSLTTFLWLQGHPYDCFSWGSCSCNIHIVFQGGLCLVTWCVNKCTLKLAVDQATADQCNKISLWKLQLIHAAGIHVHAAGIHVHVAGIHVHVAGIHVHVDCKT